MSTTDHEPKSVSRYSSQRRAPLGRSQRRALRRPVGLTAATFAVLGLALGIAGAVGARRPAADQRHLARSAPRLPAAAKILGTLRLPPRQTVLFAARERSLLVLVIPSSARRSVELVRVRADGVIARRGLAIDQPGFLDNLSPGVDGFYAGTAVIKRLSKRRDELIRIDQRTLRLRARATFPASVRTVGAGNRLWATIGDGRVARLDPRTLAVKASRRVLSARAAASGAATVSKPAYGLGGVWVLAGNARKLELVRLDPATLAVRSRARVPSGGRLAQALHDVSADSRHVYLVGGAIARVDRRGRLGRPLLVPGLETAVVYGGGLVGLTAEPAAIVRLDAAGRVVARTPVRDAGAALAVSGDDAWFAGNAGHGNGIVHLRLR